VSIRFLSGGFGDQAVRRFDVSSELRAVRAAGIQAEVIACASDTLVTPAHSRAIARLLGADYRELALDGGHMWMLTAWPAFSRLF
jgi:homoserine acetyltransferase